MFYLVLIGLAVGSILLSRNKRFLTAVVQEIESMVEAYKDWQRRKQEKWEREHPPRLFVIEHTFRAQTLSGFDIEYWMNLACERIDVAESIKAEVENPNVQKMIALDFHDDVFEPYFNERSYFWHFDHRAVSALGKLYEVFPTIIGEVVEENGTTVAREVLRQRLKAEMVMKPPYRTRGCEIRLLDFSTPTPTVEVIERNYKMLTEEQKEAIATSHAFGIGAEMLAVSLLKFRLELLRNGTKEYKADCFTIETEKAGRSLKIKWKLGPNADGYYIWAFRNTSGFSENQFSETDNGMRVVDSYNNGETVEVLDEGVAYFYTFFLQPFQPTDRWQKKSPLRFQETIETKAETAVIEEALKRFEQRKAVEPEKEKLSRALKQVGAYVEMDRAFDAMEKSFIDEIAKSDYSEEEKKRKIERLQAVIVMIRSDYEPV